MKMKATVDRRVQWTFYNSQDCACYESVNAVFLVLLKLFYCDIPWIKVPTTALCQAFRDNTDLAVLFLWTYRVVLYISHLRLDT